MSRVRVIHQKSHLVEREWTFVSKVFSAIIIGAIKKVKGLRVEVYG